MSPTAQGQSELGLAICDHRRDVVAALLRRRPGLAAAVDADGLTPLHHAVREREAETAGLLLRCGAPADTPTPDGLTPLHLAAARGDVGLVTLLLEHGADPRRPAADGRSPRDLALEGRHELCARLMDEAVAGAARRGIVLDGEGYWGEHRKPDGAPQPPRDDGTEAVAVSLAW